MNPSKAFGIVLRSLREERDLSQEALALEADLDRTYISMLERGKRQPTLSTMILLGDVLGCSGKELMARTEKLTTKKK